MLRIKKWQVISLIILIVFASLFFIASKKEDEAPASEKAAKVTKRRGLSSGVG